MHLDELRELRNLQTGVLSRRQLLEAGASDHDVRRWVRRRELTRVHGGVYVDHTGPLTWDNRCWVAVLLYWPAALSHDSVVHGAGSVIHVAVAHDRNVKRRPGIKVHLLRGLEERAQWNLAPPRLRLEDAVLTMCAKSSRVDALTLAADVCTRRRTTPSRLLTELHRHHNLRHRSWLRSVLQETAAGVRSALESSYLRKVERAHGLPQGTRQLRERTARGVVYRDIVYEPFGLVVELDGRVGHELSRDRWADMDRDLDAVVSGLATIRLGWRHAEDVPCRTAHRLAAALGRHGWQGTIRPCGTDCEPR